MPAEVTPPTKDELLDGLDGEGAIKSVHREAHDSWRHGCYIYQVFHREADDTYWAVNYNLQTNGEYHGIREDDYDIDRVARVEKQSVEDRRITT